MNKSELIRQVAEEANLSVAQATRVVNTITETITTTLSAGDEVVIPGFGKFFIRDRAARTGRNPQTGEAIQITASKAPTFKAGKTLKEAVQ